MTSAHLSILAGSSHPELSAEIARGLEARATPCLVERFPDGEFHVEIKETVRGCDVYVVQPTSPPVDEHVLELLFLADACRRAGAARLTAVVPYFGYARQDRRSRGRESVGARVVADVIGSAGFNRVISVDLHTAAIEGFFASTLEHLSAVPLLAEAVRPWLAKDSVVVAPDLGAAKMADRYGEILNLPVAVVHKKRVTGKDVTIRGLTGDVRGRAPLIIDDMITTGATIDAAARCVLEAGARAEIVVAATHGLFVGPAAARLRELGLRRLVVTDSVAPPPELELPVDVIGIAPLLADAIERLAEGRSLRAVRARV